MPAGLLPQKVVVYDRRGQKGTVFDTAYSEQQAYMALKRCSMRHGRKCNARVERALEHYHER